MQFRKTLLLFAFCLTLSKFIGATKAQNFPGFVSNWSIHHRDILQTEAHGTFAVFEHPGEEGTFIFAVNNNGKIQGKEFRHDKSPILRSIRYNYCITRSLYIENVEELTVDSLALEIDVNNETVRLTGPISQEAVNKANQLAIEEKQKKMELRSQSWRSNALKSLNKHLEQDYYKYEIKEYINKVIYKIENNNNYQESDYELFKQRLGHTTNHDHNLANN